MSVVTVMEGKRPPQVRCNNCRKTTIDVVCSVCGEPICLECGGSAYKTHSFWSWDSVNDPDIGTRRGFWNYLRGKRPEPAIYCKKCMGRVLKPLFFLFFGSFSFPFVLYLYFHTEREPLWLIVALGLLILAVTAPYIQSRRARRTMPPFRISPKTSKVSVEEMIEGRCTIDEKGGYTTEVVGNVGMGTLGYATEMEEGAFNEAEGYEGRYKQEPEDVLAGFAILRGAVDLIETDVSDEEDEGEAAEIGTFPTKLTFVERVTDDSFLATGDLRKSRKVEIKRTYQFESKTFPVQLIPYLVTEIAEEGKEQWGLQLIIRVHPNMHGNKKLVGGKINMDEVRLEVNGEITPLQYAEPSHAEKEGENVIIWKGGEITIEKPVSIYMRFGSNKLVDLENFSLSGKVSVSFAGIASSIGEIDQFTADGQKRVEKTDENENESDIYFCEFEKKVTATAVFTFDCTQMAVRRRVQKVGKRYATIAPSYKLIVSLVDRLNEKGFYVKGVQEKKPEIDQMDAYIMKRYWVIDVRQYKKSYPIDFALVLYGKEFSSVHLTLHNNPNLPHVAHGTHETHFTVTASVTVPLSVADVNATKRGDRENDLDGIGGDDGRMLNCVGAAGLPPRGHLIYDAIDDVCKHFCDAVREQQARHVGSERDES